MILRDMILTQSAQELDIVGQDGLETKWRAARARFCEQEV